MSVIMEVRTRTKEDFSRLLDVMCSIKNGILCVDYELIKPAPQFYTDTALLERNDMLMAAAYAIMEELDIEDDGLTLEDIKKYQKESKLKPFRRERFYEEDIAEISKSYKKLIEAKERYPYNDDYLNFGQKVLEIISNEGQLSLTDWRFSNWSVCTNAINTEVYSKDFAIRWRNEEDFSPSLVFDAACKAGVDAYFMYTAESDEFAGEYVFKCSEKPEVAKISRGYTDISNPNMANIVGELLGINGYEDRLPEDTPVCKKFMEGGF